MPIHPLDDDFAYGSPAYGTNLIEYLGLHPESAGTLFRSGGELHDGYSLGVAERVAAVSDGTSSESGLPYAFCTRREYAANMRVRATFATRVLGGGPMSTNQVGYSGVFARVTGTLAGDDSDDVRLEDINAYEFSIEGEENLAAAGVVGRLRRWDAGVPTVLSTSLNVALLAKLKQAKVTQPLELRLSVFGGSGEDPLIYCQIAWSGVTTPTLAISYTDTSPFAYQATSRGGFGMDKDQRYPGGGLSWYPSGTNTSTWKATTGVRTVSLFDIGQSINNAPYWTGTVYHRDRWDRAFTSTESAGPDSNGTTGSYLGGGWTGDQLMADTSTDSVIERETTDVSERVRILHSSSTTKLERRAALSVRKADSNIYQHRRITAQFPTTETADERWIGVVARAQPATGLELESLSGFTGYVARVGEEGGTKKAQVVRYNSGTATVLASYSDAGLWSAGTDFTVSLDSYASDNAPNPSSATAVLEMSVDDTQVVLVAETVPGVSATSAGTVSDALNPIFSGYGEGWYSVVDNLTGTASHEVDDWEQLTLHVPDSTQAPFFASEGVPVGSLNDVLAPDYVFTETIQDFVHETRFQSGHVQRRPRFYNPETGTAFQRRSWVVRKRVTSANEHNALAVFFDSRSGSEVPFNFTLPDGEQVVGVFVENTLQRSKSIPGAFGTEFVVLETL